jgi:hypothetical protein
MKLFIDCVGPLLIRVKLRPDLGQGVVVSSTALRARPMAGRHRSRFVEEEQLRVAPRRHEVRAASASKLQAAGDPSLCGVAPANRTAVIVKAAAVAVHEPSLAARDQVAQGCDAILAWHPSRLTRRGRRPRPASLTAG